MTALEYVRLKMNESNYYSPWQENSEFAFLQEHEEVHREFLGDRRWWRDEFIVIDLDGRLIGFSSATANRDESTEDLGWEFSTDTICYVQEKEVTRIEYEPIYE